ncbi:MAG TPA: alpha/beta hydrolase [Gemmatimonadales bacterium]|nr:alpha/beta hydrolase [Gemmatimonadales bacterium]
MPLPIPEPRESGTTSTTDVPLYWCRYGNPGGPLLLVLHGGPGAHHDYLLPQFLELARDHELVFYDQRGGGRSKTDDRTEITFKTHVEDLARVVEELGLSPLRVVGYSWGGLLAMLYAIEASREGSDFTRPEQLILVDPAPITRELRDVFEAGFAERQRGERIAAMREELAASGLRESDPDAYRQRQFELGVSGYFANPSLAVNLTPFRVTGRVQQQVWESLGQFDITAELERLSIPATVIHGRQDPIPMESSERAARALGGELIVIEDSGHVPYVEQPEALWKAIRGATAG